MECQWLALPDTGVSTLDELMAGMASTPCWEGYGSGEQTIDFIDLPSGRAGRLVVPMSVPVAVDTSVDVVAVTYVLTSGESWYQLTCDSMDTPADLWLPLAESFQLTSADD